MASRGVSLTPTAPWPSSPSNRRTPSSSVPPRSIKRMSLTPTAPSPSPVMSFLLESGPASASPTTSVQPSLKASEVASSVRTVSLEASREETTSSSTAGASLAASISQRIRRFSLASSIDTKNSRYNALRGASLAASRRSTLHQFATTRRITLLQFTTTSAASSSAHSTSLSKTASVSSRTNSTLLLKATPLGSPAISIRRPSTSQRSYVSSELASLAPSSKPRRTPPISRRASLQRSAPTSPRSRRGSTVSPAASRRRSASSQKESLLQMSSLRDPTAASFMRSGSLVDLLKPPPSQKQSTSQGAALEQPTDNRQSQIASPGDPETATTRSLRVPVTAIMASSFMRSGSLVDLTKAMEEKDEGKEEEKSLTLCDAIKTQSTLEIHSAETGKGGGKGRGGGGTGVKWAGAVSLVLIN